MPTIYTRTRPDGIARYVHVSDAEAAAYVLGGWDAVKAMRREAQRLLASERNGS